MGVRCVGGGKVGGEVWAGRGGDESPPRGTLPLGGAGISPSGQPQGRNPTGQADGGVEGVCPGGQMLFATGIGPPA